MEEETTCSLYRRYDAARRRGHAHQSIREDAQRYQYYHSIEVDAKRGGVRIIISKSRNLDDKDDRNNLNLRDSIIFKFGKYEKFERANIFNEHFPRSCSYKTKHLKWVEVKSLLKSLVSLFPGRFGHIHLIKTAAPWLHNDYFGNEMMEPKAISIRMVRVRNELGRFFSRQLSAPEYSFQKGCPFTEGAPTHAKSVLIKSNSFSRANFLMLINPNLESLEVWAECFGTLLFHLFLREWYQGRLPNLKRLQVFGRNMPDRQDKEELAEWFNLHRRGNDQPKFITYSDEMTKVDMTRRYFVSWEDGWDFVREDGRFGTISFSYDIDVSKPCKSFVVWPDGEPAPHPTSIPNWEKIPERRLNHPIYVKRKPSSRKEYSKDNTNNEPSDDSEDEGHLANDAGSSEESWPRTESSESAESADEEDSDEPPVHRRRLN